MEDVRNWLRGLGLGQYASKFEELGWDTLEILQHMGSDDIKECIDKPGHRRKFELGLKDSFPSHAALRDEAINFVAGSTNETSLIRTETENFQHISDLGYESKLSSLITSQKPDQDRSDAKTVNNLVEPPSAADKLGSDTESERHKDEAAVVTAGAEERVERVEETIYVKGASNKILTSGLGKQSNEKLKEELKLESIYGGSISRGFVASRANLQSLETLNREDMKRQTDDDTSSSHSEEDDKSALSNVNEIEMARQLLRRRPTRPLMRATVVKDSKNVTIAKKAEVYQICKEEKKKPMDNFKEQMSHIVKSYKAKDHLFVETRAFQEVKDILDDGYWALIAGKPGDGKSAMAAHLLLQYKEKGFESIIMTCVQDWKVMVCGSDDTTKAKSQFVMIDDMFGSMSVDDKKVNEWVSMLDIMQRVIKEGEGEVRVICTSRTYVFKDVKSKIERFTCFQESKIVDLALEKHAFTPEEKMQIWTNYTNEYNVTSSPPNCIFDPVISPHGFPHCVELFCSNQFLRQEGLSFFENPMRCVCLEIQNFKDNDKIKYCLLLLILFKDNKLEMNYLQEVVLSDPPKDVIKIFKAAGLSTDHAQSELKKALTSLKNTYICEDLDETFRFSHESIRENVAFMCIKDSPLHAIEYVDFRYLVDHTKCYGYPLPCHESVLVLPSFCTNALVERTVREIKAGKIIPVCQHQAWTDRRFVEKWIAYILEASSSRVEKEETVFLSELFCKKNQNRTVGELNFIEVLIYFRHEQALLQLLRHDELVKRFHSDQMKQMLSHALVFASLITSRTCIARSLIKAGADIAFKLRSIELFRYFLIEPLNMSNMLTLIEMDLVPFDFQYGVEVDPESLQIIRDILLHRNMDINTRRDTDTSTLLMIACENVLPDIVRLLLSSNADPNISDMLGHTCLTKLVNSLALTYMSILNVCYNRGNLQRESALHIQSTLWNPQDTRQFCRLVTVTELQFKDSCYTRLLHINCAALDILTALLINGADPNSTDITGKTALHYFVESPISDLFVCPAMKILLEHGANVNCKDFEGMTPLMACSRFPGRKSRRMTIVMAAGANILETDYYGCDAVDYGRVAFGGISLLSTFENPFSVSKPAIAAMHGPHNLVRFGD